MQDYEGKKKKEILLDLLNLLRFQILINLSTLIIKNELKANEQTNERANERTNE